jgi:hemolysin activation/secretion protein
LLDEANKVLHTGNVSLLKGDFVEGVDDGQDAKYYIVSSDYNYLGFWKIPYFDANSRFIFRTSLQLTDSALSSIEQFALAGATRARGFVANQFSADNAVYAGFEWLFNSPDIFNFELAGKTRLSDVAQPFLFADASYGVKKSLVEDEPDETGQLSDAGFGLRFSYLKDFSGNLQFAFPIKHKFENSDLVDIDDGMKVVFDFQYSFL